MSDPVPAPKALGATVGRNVASYFAARLVEAVLLFVTLPLLTRGLGPERYGLFSFGLITLFYLAVLELGMSQAQVSLLSESRARQDARSLEGLLGSSLVLYAIAALAGGLGVALLAPAAGRLVQIPPGLASEATAILRLVALAFALLLLQSPPRSILTSFHRASTVNWGLLAGAALKFPAMLVVLKLHGGLVPTFAAYAGGAVVELAVTSVSAARLLKRNALRPRWDGVRARELLRFGAATSISTLAGMLLIHLDKIVIGLNLPIAVLGVYHVAYSVAGRIAEIPRGVVGAVPAALSELASSGQAERLARAYQRTLKILFAAPLHLATLLVVAGEGLLRAWVGPEIAREGGGPLRLLAAAYFLSGLAHAPYMLASAAGFPGVPAKARAFLLLPGAALVVVLTRLRGIEGAALACLIHQATDLAVMFVWVHRRARQGFSPAPFWKPLALSAGLGAATYAVLGHVSGLAGWLAVLGLSYALYLAGVFAWVMDPEDRAMLKRRES